MKFSSIILFTATSVSAQTICSNGQHPSTIGGIEICCSGLIDFNNGVVTCFKGCSSAGNSAFPPCFPFCSEQPQSQSTPESCTVDYVTTFTRSGATAVATIAGTTTSSTSSMKATDFETIPSPVTSSISLTPTLATRTVAEAIVSQTSASITTSSVAALPSRAAGSKAGSGIHPAVPLLLAGAVAVGLM